MPETLEGKRETDKMRAHSYFSMADAAKTAVPHTRCTQGHREAERKRQMGSRKKWWKGVCSSDGSSPIWWPWLFNRQFIVSLAHSFARSCSLSADENLVGWGSGTGLSLVLGEGLDCWREWSFFSSGVKGGRSCVQSLWQKALLCAAYADRGGSFVHRWRSHAWVCLRRRGKGGRRGEKSVGRRGSAITVSGGGRGRRKGEPSHPGPARLWGGATNPRGYW